MGSTFAGRGYKRPECANGIFDTRLPDLSRHNWPCHRLNDARLKRGFCWAHGRARNAHSANLRGLLSHWLLFPNWAGMCSFWLKTSNFAEKCPTSPTRKKASRTLFLKNTFLFKYREIGWTGRTPGRIFDFFSVLVGHFLQLFSFC